MRKGFKVVTDPYLLRTFASHRVAAASEHLDVIRLCEANSLLDVGANKGQFSIAFRRFRPNASIIAFEPLPEVADVYDTVFRRDEHARLQRVALADREGSAQFHVADRTDSSSLLRPGKGQERAFGVRSDRMIDVPVDRLDERVDIGSLARPILMKVDVQGGELDVFRGCKTLEDVDFVYVELSFVELYDGQPLFREVMDYLVNRNFVVAGIFNQVATAQFGPTQVDVLFKRGQA
jgi:FkbM family methyltransferase